MKNNAEQQGAGAVCPACGGPCSLASAEPDGTIECPRCGHRFDPGRVPTAAAPPVPGSGVREPSFEPGTRIGGYRIVELIGRGGMGRVYRATQISLGRPVALKILDGRLALDPVFRRRFERESEALTKLEHPNIVRIIDRGSEDGVCFFVMELVEGRNLREWMSDRRPEYRECVRIAEEVCDALAYAHGRGIIHRDIKPENILIDRTGRVKIADFGLSRILRTTDGEPVSRLTQTRLAMGTFDYISPEQRESARYADARSDLFALGVVLYEMLTGELPLGNFDPPSRLARVPESIDAVVLRALQKDPRRRFETAAEMRAALETARRIPRAEPPPALPSENRDAFDRPLVRSRADRKIAGVCGGIAEWLGIQPIWVRLVWVILFVAGGGIPVLIAYAGLAILIPDDARRAGAYRSVMPPPRNHRPRRSRPPRIHRTRPGWAWAATLGAVLGGFWLMRLALPELESGAAGIAAVVRALTRAAPSVPLSALVVLAALGIFILMSGGFARREIRRSRGMKKGRFLVFAAWLVGAGILLFAGFAATLSPRAELSPAEIGTRGWFATPGGEIVGMPPAGLGPLPLPEEGAGDLPVPVGTSASNPRSQEGGAGLPEKRTGEVSPSRRP